MSGEIVFALTDVVAIFVAIVFKSIKSGQLMFIFLLPLPHYVFN